MSIKASVAITFMCIEIIEKYIHYFDNKIKINLNEIYVIL